MARLQSPLPTDLQTALEEIQRLRNQIIQTNVKWANLAERRERDNRSSKGTINALQKKMTEAKALLRASVTNKDSDMVADMEDAMDLL